MKKQSILLALLVFSLHSVSVAQKSGAKFHSINSVGLIAGKSGNAFEMQTVNGIKKDYFFTGIGFGMNNYRFESYPLFADVRVFPGKSRSFFGYGNLGYNFNGKNEPEKNIYYNTAEFTGGVYTSVGAGVQLKLAGNASVVFDVGFAYKEIKNKIGVVNPCLVGPCPVDYSYYAYGLGTVILKAGIAF